MEMGEEADALDTLLGGGAVPSSPRRPSSHVGSAEREEEEREEAAYRNSHTVNIHAPFDHHTNTNTNTNTNASNGSHSNGVVHVNQRHSARDVSQIDDDFDESKYTDASFEDFEEESGSEEDA